MIKKTVTYSDYNGVERTEDFYFNFTKAELVEMQITTEGGVDEMLARIVKSKNGPEAIRIFKDLVLKAYGVKSDDGRRFIKNEEVKTAFVECPAYSEIFLELASDDKAAAAFVNGIIPNDIQITDEEREKAMEELGLNNIVAINAHD